MNKILKLTIILFLVCAVTAGILGCVNALTEGRIAAITEQKTMAAYSEVLKAPGFENVAFDAQNPVFAEVKNIAKATDGTGWVVESTFSGAQGTITMATGIDADYKCSGISIISHSETSGLGANAASKAEVGIHFRAQFVGAEENVALKKSGGTIDALSGATITSSAVTKAVADSIAAVKALG